MHCLNCGGVLIGISKKFCCVECKTEHNSKNKKEARHALTELDPNKNCLWCGKHYKVTLSTAHKRYCCESCKKRDKSKRKKMGVLSDYVADVNKYKRVCKRCGIEFSGTELQTYCNKDCQNKKICPYCGTAHNNVGDPFCSDRCKHDWDLIKIGTRVVCKQCGYEFDWFGNSSIVYCSDECRINKAIKDYQESFVSEAKPTECTCKECGSGFMSKTARGSHYCSVRCRDRANKRMYGNNNIQRAKAFGVMYEYFDENKVLSDCGYVCYLCGERTPKELRGTLDDTAPEVEHIISFADGGSHSPDNTACACRSCNNRKGSDTMLMSLYYINIGTRRT